ncbi:hypothetical protein [Leptospira sp. GIMC2001]|uniref:hypothetical protein n=1 Tax=Leptospira sp. GIMC2001 TaxID=1513297 RepID=UPI002348FCA1|nr:hypothetical protein [Leptospira sp. GIMC2001]WCL50450.1 hypothetical protein O4O04_06415 [Leptospira sp. GIMC2001]
MESSISDTKNAILLVGKEANHVTHELLASLSAKGVSIHVVDCGMSFRAFRLADSTKGLDFPVLHEVLVQRAFTPYQLMDFINGLLLDRDNLERKSRLYAFLAPSKEFFDKDIKEDERRFLLESLVAKFNQLQEEGFSLLISESRTKEELAYDTYILHLKEAVHCKLIEPIRQKEIDNGKNSRSLFS